MKTYYKSHNDTSIDNIADSSADNSDDNATVLPSKTLTKGNIKVTYLNLNLYNTFLPLKS